MVDALASGVEDKLVNSFKFNLKPGASYVTNRRSCTYHPSGSNIYTPQGGTRLIKLQLTGDQWLDPSTFRVMFDLTNTESPTAAPDKKLRVIGGPWTFFRRMRILSQGAIVEDIDDFARVSEMFSTLTSSDSRLNDDAEGFGQSKTIREWHSGPYTTLNFNGIAPGDSQTVLFKPLSGLLSQENNIPLRYSPLTIELELVDDPLSPIVSDWGTGANSFKEENTSIAWRIENVQVKVDLLTLDNALENSFAQHLLDGGSLPINYNTYISQVLSTVGGIVNGVSVGQKDIQHTITRAVARLKSVFVTLDHAIPSEEAYVARKSWNDFYSPMHPYAGGLDNAYNSDGEFEFQLQVGSKQFPEYPMRSHAEAFYQLKKCLGVQASTLHNFDIDSHEYRNYKMILGIDTEMILSAGFSGLNTKSGDMLCLKFKHKDTNNLNYATKMQVVLHSDNIMQVRDSGVEIMD
jgi:hypothetical protein